MRRAGFAIAAALAFAIFAFAILLGPAPACAAGYTLQTLYDFRGTRGSQPNTGGANPKTSVTLDGQGHLYGTTTTLEGVSQYGTLFEYDLSTQIFTLLADLSAELGGPANAVTLDGQGRLYGTTLNGGAYGEGTLFEYDLASGALTTLVAFNGSNGAGSLAPVALDGHGHLYGTTQSGGGSNGTGGGTLFEYSLAAHTLTTLVKFIGPNGLIPQGNIALDGQGHLFGTTSGGGADNYGLVFEYNLARHVRTTLAAFNGTTQGSFPNGVTWDSAGSLYGTTSNGGPSNEGTLWQCSIATHSLTALASFTGPNGKYPYAGVTLDGQGSLFGTTTNGGTADQGTVYKYNLALRRLTTLASLSYSTGISPYAPVTLDESGVLYGTTYKGGAHNTGTVYTLTPNP